MKVEFTKKFENQVERLRDEKLKLEIANAVRSVMAADALHDIPKLKNNPIVGLQGVSFWQYPQSSRHPQMQQQIPFIHLKDQILSSP